MNLSKTTKEQIVNKIMRDVPEVDYGQLIHDVVQAEALRRKSVQDILSLAETQAKARESMREKLFTMLAGIRTLKQAKTLLEPELHKYLPAEPPKADAKAAQASVALVPYVVDALKEMGWPKTKEVA